MNVNKIKIPKPVVLIILDGWGVSQAYPGNAISQARTTAINSYISNYPTMTIRASGEAVGLPWGDAGNSEVGHINLGLGRVVYQDLSKINKHIGENTFNSNPELLAAIEHAKKNDSKLHLIGLTSSGAVHSSIDHLYALLTLTSLSGLSKVFVHAILDGRDTSLDSGENFIANVESFMVERKIGKIATVSGRFYAMDRNNNWDRISLAYETMVDGTGNKSTNAITSIQESYKKKIFDEEFIPTVITENDKPVATIDENDAIIFFNFRPDRARQITRAFVLPDFDRFKRKKVLVNIYFVAFTEYEKNVPIKVAFPKEENTNSLGELISKAGLTQLRIAETEKYAHVTYFFNGGKETKSRGEEHVLVSSKSVSSYDQVPEMSSLEITNKVVDAISDNLYDFILINFANADMVGHTGNIEAAIKGVECIDSSVEKIVNSVLAKNGVVMITADHGNAEVMFNMQTGQIDKEHTANPVPFILIGKEYAGRSIGWLNAVGEDLSTAQPQGILSDVAPTVLRILGIKKPDEMTGLSLLD